MRLAEAILAKHSFAFFVEAETLEDLVFPDQIALIKKELNPRAQFYLKIKQDVPLDAFGKDGNKNFSVNTHINSSNKPEMVYISGPTSLYQSLEAPLRRTGLTSDRIFLV